MDESTRIRACELFSALSHPVRLQIVESLYLGPRSVGEIAQEMGIGQSGASQHLAILARAGVLDSEARGPSRFYKLRGPRIPAILSLIDEFCHVHRLYGVPSESAEELAEVEKSQG